MGTKRVGAEKYVLVTPTRNNEATIGETLAAVTGQRKLPARWVIVSDGSTDGTDQIVRECAERHPFIRLLRVEPSDRAGFGSKVAAFNAGYATLVDVEYDFVGNLDADVSFAPYYFERLLRVFAGEPRLGLVGGTVIEVDQGHARAQRVSSNSVAGAVQLFRRECFEQTGGFVPLPLGGEDSTAEIMARALGWSVRTVFELAVTHDGRIGGRHGGMLRARFSKGVTNYLLGYDPLFHLAVSAYRMTDPPYVVGGVLMLSGYGWAALRHLHRVLPVEGVHYLREEQRARIRTLLARRPYRPANGSPSRAT